MFKKVENAKAVLTTTTGEYYPADVYMCLGFVYAKVGSKFVRLNAAGSTSKTGNRLYALEWPGSNLRRDRLGALCDIKAIPDALELGKVNYKLVYV